MPSTATELSIPSHQIRRGGWLSSYFTERKSESRITQGTGQAVED